MTTPAHILHTHFGFSAFRPGQEQAITALLGGENTLVVMPTGAGKSLVYQLAALCLPEPAITLVLSPLIALMHDQVESLTRRDIPATFINSTLPVEEQTRRLYATIRGDYRLLYIAPERLRRAAFQDALRRMTSACWLSMKPTASPTGGTTSAPTTAALLLHARRWVSHSPLR